VRPAERAASTKPRPSPSISWRISSPAGAAGLDRSDDPSDGAAHRGLVYSGPVARGCVALTSERPFCGRVRQHLLDLSGVGLSSVQVEPHMERRRANASIDHGG
jgi:hypothetical protein